MRVRTDPTTPSPVSLWFKDDRVADIFSSLLEAWGVDSVRVFDIDELGQDRKLITEPLFFGSLNKEQKGRCLLVSNAKSPATDAAFTLLRPLTEESVESTLSVFLRAGAPGE
jgi:hypothetical protein